MFFPKMIYDVFGSSSHINIQVSILLSKTDPKRDEKLQLVMCSEDVSFKFQFENTV